MKANDIYADVTNTIIELLESHQLEEFKKPWLSLGQDNDYARNTSTGRYYSGINQFLLSYKLMKKGYLKNVWMTYQQISAEGGHVKKSEKSTPVIFYKTAWVDKNKKYYAPDTVKKMGFEKSQALGISSIPVVKLYRVFNTCAQTEGLSSEHYEIENLPALTPFEEDECAENLIRATHAKIDIRQSNEAYYDRSCDTIVIPLREQFNNQKERYYSVVLHELGHWTGAKDRLDRVSGKSFGDADYAFEELVAELIAAMCCARLGFTKTISQNAAYLKSWLAILKSDSRAIVKAASAAQKGADYIFDGGAFSVKKTRLL